MNTATGAAAPDARALDQIAAEKMVELGINAALPTVKSLIEMHVHNNLQVMVSEMAGSLYADPAGKLILSLRIGISTHMAGIGRSHPPQQFTMDLDANLHMFNKATGPDRAPIVDLSKQVS